MPVGLCQGSFPGRTEGTGLGLGVLSVPPSCSAAVTKATIRSQHLLACLTNSVHQGHACSSWGHLHHGYHTGIRGFVSSGSIALSDVRRLYSRIKRFVWSSCTEHYKAVSDFLAPQTNTSPNAKPKHTQNNIHSTFSQWERIITLQKKFFMRKKFWPFWWSLHLLILQVKIFYSFIKLSCGCKENQPCLPEGCV